MITVISPSKTLDYTSVIALGVGYTQPQLASYSQNLIQYCKALSIEEIMTLMKISHKLAELNYERFQNWQSEGSLENSRQAIFAFKGDVYEGVCVDDFTDEDMSFSQMHLRILSGLYGILRPLDLMQPYRLEMGIKLKNGKNKNLYQFWKAILTSHLSMLLDQQASRMLINLASNEYFKAIDVSKLNAEVIQPIFLDESNGDFKVISFYAKRARGLMARYIIKNKIMDAEKIKQFNESGYQFDIKRSNECEWFFTRRLPAK